MGVSMTANELYQERLDDIVPSLSAEYSAGYKPALLRLVRARYWQPIRDEEARTGKRQRRKSSAKLLAAAFVLSRLDYWTQRSKRSDGIVYKSTRALAEELGLTRREIEDGTNLLAAWGWVRWTIPAGRERHYQVLYAGIVESIATLTAGSEGFVVPTLTTGTEGTLTNGSEGALTVSSEGPPIAGSERIKDTPKDNSKSTSNPPNVRASARGKDREDRKNHRDKNGKEAGPSGRLADLIDTIDPAAVRADDAAWTWAERWAKADRLGLSTDSLAAVAHLVGGDRLDRLDTLAERVAVAQGYRTPKHRPVQEQRWKYWAQSLLSEPGLVDNRGPISSEAREEKRREEQLSVKPMPDHSPEGKELIAAITADAGVRIGDDEKQWTDGLRAIRYGKGWILVARWPGLARQLRARHGPEHTVHGVSDLVTADDYWSRYVDEAETTATLKAHEEVST